VIALAAVALASLLLSAGVASADWSSASTIDNSAGLFALACVSTTECVASDLADPSDIVVYNPSSPGTAQMDTHIEDLASSPLGIDALACSTATQCTVVDDNGQWTTLGLGAPGDPGSPAYLSLNDSNGSFSVACPGVNECVAMDGVGDEQTFNPLGPAATAAPVPLLPGAANAVSCTSTIQCTAVGAGGYEDTFDPQSPSADPQQIDTHGSLFSVDCPSRTFCDAVDNVGYQIAFAPTLFGANASAPVDIDGATTLESVACPTRSQCVAADDGGNIVTFDPSASGGQLSSNVNGSGNKLFAVVCPALMECVAVGEQNGGNTGTSAVGYGSTPSATSPPTITGTAIAGGQLTESHGNWANQPGSYSYQWQSCDASGNNCQAIAGATGQTLNLTSADIGGTIRVSEAASNLIGASSALTSSATSVVAPNAQLAATQTHGKNATLILSCVGGSPCTLGVTLTVVETLKGTTVIAVTAKAHKAHTHTETVAVGSENTTLAAEASGRVTMTLNSAGAKLLADRHSFTATLTITQQGGQSGMAAVASTTLHFTKPKSHRHKK
jgi:hypothetical protein